MPFVKKRQRHDRNCVGGVATDRAFCKKTPKARSKWRGGGRNRPCLSQKKGKGTVENAEQGAQPTVPFAKNGQRHGRNGGAEGATDRAFCKKTPKARSKSRRSGRGRPCLWQKNAKGTVEIVEHGSRPTVPFVKKRQRHGRNGGAECATDRAFCKKTPKARSKLEGGGHIRPCLLQKNVKGTVEIAGWRAYPTVPFAKKR